MPVYPKEVLLADLSDQTESFLYKAISQWQNMQAEKFASPPGPGQWSARDCLSHLNSYGAYYLPLIEKALVNASVPVNPDNTSFKSGWLGNYFIQLMKPTTQGRVSKKMKAAVKHTPESNAKSHEVIATFIDQQEKMLSLLEKAANNDLERTRIPISINRWIRLQLGDIFLFLITHTERHIAQAERAMNH